jgi:hypothetical protein
VRGPGVAANKEGRFLQDSGKLPQAELANGYRDTLRLISGKLPSNPSLLIATNN